MKVRGNKAFVFPAQVEELAELMQGGTVQAELVEGVIYNDISENSDALYSLLLNTGYLTLKDYPDPYEGDDCTMRIPNWEIHTLFKKEVMRYLSGLGSDGRMLKKLLASLLSGNADDRGRMNTLSTNRKSGHILLQYADKKLNE